MGTGARGLGWLRSRLEAAGMEVAEFNPIGAVPPETSVVIVPGPETPLQAEAVDRLKGFVEGGGRLVVLIDNRQETGLESWLGELGVAIEPGLIVDGRLAYRQAQLPFRRSARTPGTRSSRPCGAGWSWSPSPPP